MKIIKKLFAVLLIMGLSFSLSGCKDTPGEGKSAVKLTPQVQESLDVALKASTITSRHELLDEGIKHCKTVEDIKALARAANTITKRHEILQKGISLCKTADENIGLALMAQTITFRHEILSKGVPLCKNVDDIVNIANKANTITFKHEVLRAGVPLAKSSDDILKLATMANTKSFKEELLKKAPGLIEQNAKPEASAAVADSNALMKAQQEMLAAQALYKEAIEKQSAVAEIKKLSDDYLQKKEVFENLKN